MEQDLWNKDQEMDKLLDLSGYSISSLKEGVAVFAPIIGAAIPLLLKPKTEARAGFALGNFMA
ncbi:MAG: hypothetical protein QNK18_15780 [Gammaproteobacteria bacterium]|nr:hypothetical protein [Gammaproteobacteria bacterium]MDJ0892638.1 hypothetical protein [Gammaproteobacteria bacterium]